MRINRDPGRGRSVSRFFVSGPEALLFDMVGLKGM
jgi:hypothetical protein